MRPQGIRHPARLVPIAFLVAIAIGTAVLMLPMARAGPGGAPFLTALFHATSAVCVTGLITVDTPTYWSPFGMVVLLFLFQVGGFGIMSAATLLGLLAGRRLQLSARLVAREERGTLDMSDVMDVLRLILIVTVGVELFVTIWLTLVLHFGHGLAWGPALWNGLFHGVSAFTNAGFSTYSDSLAGFRSDFLFLFPIMAGVLAGALGFPVLYELRREPLKPSTWSLHSKVTLAGSAILLAAGFVAILAAEWSNPATLGPMGVGDKLLNAAFHSVTPRSAGFNTLDTGALRMETLSVNYVLMFIGGGSAGTAGGIKVTTFFLLGLVVWSEIRGERDVAIFRRRIGTRVERQALTIVLLAIGLVGVATLIVLSLTDFPFSDVLFETISAFATVGLSTGITAHLPGGAQMVIIVLMFVGRVGTITVATALALGGGQRSYRYPEERPIVG
ncbi:MAG TPA: potassium transporter TrkG [Allosphingosinicella sp.]|nr:potassium transporter TrkG [Allosphingosinicella sp.]